MNKQIYHSVRHPDSIIKEEKHCWNHGLGYYINNTGEKVINQHNTFTLMTSIFSTISGSNPAITDDFNHHAINEQNWRCIKKFIKIIGVKPLLIHNPTF